MYHLIIADDEPLIRTGLLYRNDWKQMGFEVDALLEDGSDVLKYLEDHRADVLLTDICMYQVSGLAAAAQIRERYPWMKIVLLSGYREFEYAREAIRCQVYEYLLKPVDSDAIRRVFENIRRELDEAAHEEQLLRSFGEGEYEQILSLTRAVTGSVLGEGEEAWMAYARLKPVMLNAPTEVREVLVKRLLEQLQSKLVLRAPQLAERFSTQLRSLNLSDPDGAHRQLLELLSGLNDDLVSGNFVKPERRAADDSIAKACNYINNHLGDEFTYRDVAEFVHLSPRHFIRRFRSEMGETFTDYLMRVRLEGAQRLLDEGQANAANVSAAVGYRDDKYFQKLFKKHVGCTTREYERRKQGETR